MAERQDPKLIAKKIFDKQRQILDYVETDNKEILQVTTFMATYASLEIMKIMLTTGNTGLVTGTINELEALLKFSLPKAHIKIRSAVPLSEWEKQELKNIFKKQLEKDILLTTDIDEELLGGIVVEYDGKILDLSVSEELDKLKKHLLDAVNKGK
jgi:ATP synthase F1 delta subunit